MKAPLSLALYPGSGYSGGVSVPALIVQLLVAALASGRNPDAAPADGVQSPAVARPVSDKQPGSP